MAKNHREFKTPPVVEAWIKFKFELSEESIPWDENAAEYFIKEYFKDFKPESFSRFAQVRVDAKTKSLTLAPDSIFDKIRAFTRQKDYCIQAGRDILVFNQIKKEKWPKFDNMRDKALEAVQHYMNFRGLTKLMSVELHYRDIISIPKGKGDLVDLKDYFMVGPEIPEESFGNVSGFNLAVQLPNIYEKGNTILRIQSLPHMDSGAKYNFAWDWHVSSTEKVDDLEAAEKWLNEAHKDLRSSFESAFTEKCLDLFGIERR